MNEQQNKKRLFWVKPTLCESTRQALDDFYKNWNVKMQIYSEIT